MIRPDFVPLNVGDGLNEENGVFKAPFAGHYKFNFSTSYDLLGPGQVEYGLGTMIKVMKNHKDEFQLGNEEPKEGFNISYTWIWDLKAGDEVYLTVDINSQLKASETGPITFIGELVYANP